VLEQLQEFGLYCKAEKYQFGVSEVDYLGFMISSEGVGMELDRISTIEDWPTPESVHDIQVLLGFTNFYWRFIRKYAKVTCPHTELLKTADNPSGAEKLGPSSNRPRYKKSGVVGKNKWEWTRKAELAFRKLKKAFNAASILQHFDPTKPIVLQTDVSGFAIAGI
jgi:hypothetical protein